MYTYISAFRHIPVFIWHSVHLRWMLFGKSSHQLLRSSELIPCICNWFDRSQLVDLGWNAFRIQPSKKRRWYHQSPLTTSRQGRKNVEREIKSAKSLWWKKNQENSVCGNFPVFPGNFESPCYSTSCYHYHYHPNHDCGNLEFGKIPKADATCSEKGVGSIEPASQFDTSLHFPKPCCEIDLELGGILCIISLEAYWG